MTVECITLHLTLTHINNFTSSCTFYQHIQSHVTNIRTYIVNLRFIKLILLFNENITKNVVKYHLYYYNLSVN